MKKIIFLAFPGIIACSILFAQTDKKKSIIIPAADRLDQYLPLIGNKRVAIFSNHTAMVGDTHLVDTLFACGVNIKKIFAPEHGFRGTADAGEKVDNTVDARTGVPVVSLYGKKRKPSKEDLEEIDLLIFDIQDVGVRFYTYISSLQEYMEAAIEHDKPLIILDRPNPNGFYVDGPVLNRKFKSFVGMQPVPVVYGMTIGEYAKMLIGEKWIDSSLHKKLLQNSVASKITVIPCENYTHKMRYDLPERPSPNLPEIQSIYWYPSTCYFEGTVLSEGRGTEKPFQVFGHPTLPKSLYSFMPVSREGAKEPKLKDQQCYGWNLSGTPDEVFKKVDRKIQLKYLLEAYRLFPQKDNFFLKNNFIDRLAGNDQLRKQIVAGKSEAVIRKSWEPELNKFKKIRKKYLIYPDF
jgi:uncharacterized protein YbbC (DUF1343 family)